jgi:short-subunit dehydrogenase
VAEAGPWTYRGRWALITGASAGLGEAFAGELARRGMNLVLTARREDRLRQIGAALTAEHGIQVRSVPADLADRASLDALWHTASQGRSIDLLVNNAGFGAQGFFTEIPAARQAEMLDVNCIAVLRLAHLALGEMTGRRDGGIINVASIAAFQPVPTLATYAATKAFVLSLSRALHEEARGSGVRVLALCPGRTPTEFQRIAGTGPVDRAFGLRSPEAVVRSALAAFERDHAYAVPGVENYLASWLTRLLPGSAVTRLLKRLVQRAASTS